MPQLSKFQHTRRGINATGTMVADAMSASMAARVAFVVETRCVVERTATTMHLHRSTDDCLLSKRKKIVLSRVSSIKQDSLIDDKHV